MLGDANLWNNHSFSLCATLFVYYVVTISDNWMKSKVGVSADWCIAIKHWRLSSIRIIFIDYQTGECYKLKTLELVKRINLVLG